MILEPDHLLKLASRLDAPVFDLFGQRLLQLHDKYKVVDHNIVAIPKYWSETVYYGLQDIIDSVPGVRFGSIVEYKNKLMINAIPAFKLTEELKRKVYNDVDTLVIDTVDRLVKNNERPIFLT